MDCTQEMTGGGVECYVSSVEDAGCSVHCLIVSNWFSCSDALLEELEQSSKDPKGDYCFLTHSSSEQRPAAAAPETGTVRNQKPVASGTQQVFPSVHVGATYRGPSRNPFSTMGRLRPCRTQHMKVVP